MSWLRFIMNASLCVTLPLIPRLPVGIRIDESDSDVYQAHPLTVYSLAKELEESNHLRKNTALSRESCCPWAEIEHCSKNCIFTRWRLFFWLGKRDPVVFKNDSHRQPPTTGCNVGSASFFFPQRSDEASTGARCQNHFVLDNALPAGNSSPCLAVCCSWYYGLKYISFSRWIEHISIQIGHPS